MFTAADQLHRDIEEVKAVVLWQEALRNAINSIPSVVTPDLTIEASTMSVLRARAPGKLAWQIFDHYAAVTRIYALFEKAIENLVGEFLAILPSVTAGYDKLNDRIRQQHRIGVGQILGKWSSSNPLYASLPERDIAAGLADGLRGMSYALLLHAFLVSPENFRSGAIVTLFSALGFDNAFAFVSKSPKMDEFVRTRLAGAETADSFLDGFVRIRNEAAHGSGSSLVSASEILNYADFAVVIVESLVTLLRSHTLRLGLASGQCVTIGDVLHVFSDNIVGVKASSNENVKIGDSLYAGSKTLEPVEIVSLRIVKDDRTSIDLNPGFEFGVKLDRKVPWRAQLLRWNP